jgi:hypothetical protein
MTSPTRTRQPGRWLLLIALGITTLVYWPGLSGSWLFDDYPNIVENPGVQPSHASVASLTRAALSSPSSLFKRPLSSLSFAANYLVSGLHPFSWKLTNLVIHLLNGILAFFLARMLLRSVRNKPPDPMPPLLAQEGVVAALIAGAWMLLPINLTGVLYVVQRMESLANLFVMLGLVGYVAGRLRMLQPTLHPDTSEPSTERHNGKGLLLCIASLIIPTVVGITAKETAVMLPLYAFLIEWIVFRFQSSDATRRSRSVLSLFVVVLLLPMLIGLAWLIPHVLNPDNWSTRDFTLGTRLLSEARIVVGYIAWTLLPLPHWLSFYHDDFHVSTGLLHPWTTLASILVLGLLVVGIFAWRKKRPLVALGLALFLGCHLLTGSIIPLELIYEHRNYFASFGLMLAIIPLLAVPSAQPHARLRQAVLAALLLMWSVMTALTAYAWGSPLRLARDLAARAPASPRAQYELGRIYIIDSHYDPASPFTPMVYAPLERAARLPDSSILPQQALIFFNARMHRPIKPAWWGSMIASLKAKKPGVQDESSLAALTDCARKGLCPLPQKRMQQAFEAALSHPEPDARLFATYGDYAWNVMGNHSLGLHMTEQAVARAPDVPAYHITLARMYLRDGKLAEAQGQIRSLERLNIGGRLQGSIDNLKTRVEAAHKNSP